MGNNSLITDQEYWQNARHHAAMGWADLTQTVREKPEGANIKECFRLNPNFLQ